GVELDGRGSGLKSGYLERAAACRAQHRATHADLTFGRRASQVEISHFGRRRRSLDGRLGRRRLSAFKDELEHLRRSARRLELFKILHRQRKVEASIPDGLLLSSGRNCILANETEHLFKGKGSAINERVLFLRCGHA